MNRLINNWLRFLTVLSAIVLFFTACNKDLPDATPITPTPPSGSSIAETISGDANFSLLKFAINRAGLNNLLADKSATFTFFAPDNTAFQLSGFADTNAIKFLPAAQWNAIISYNLIGGQKYTAASITPANPSQNAYLQSTLVIQAPSAALPPGLRMPIFPGKIATGLVVNNIPVTQADIAVANGVIHKTLAIVAPPTRVLADTIYRVADLTYYKAAIARADSGATGLSRFDSLLKYPVTNMTVLVPNDDAFRTLIFGLAYGKALAATGDPATANAMAAGAVAAGPAFLSTDNITTADIRAILAYHFLASPNAKGAYEPNYRAFSINFSSTPTAFKTLINGAVAVHPGVMAQSTFTGPLVSGLTFSSYGSFPPGGAPFSYTANVVGKDRNAVNGVFHIIDKVLLPQ
ncbi:fasciclin domain-containing protein [Terrimonas alba]|uniref:fasciclin domain-containing protein n=1 Tax=Terrimonas alba TaxID=3349636 RepID=UPI0035F4713B